jgi:hypothetical protein
MYQEIVQQFRSKEKYECRTRWDFGNIYVTFLTRTWSILWSGERFGRHDSCVVSLEDIEELQKSWVRFA